MTKEKVLQFLREDGGFVSGEQMSTALSLSRSAVWKAVKTLKQEGYGVESVTNRGYRLVATTENLRKEEIQQALGDHPWASHLLVLESVDSTNTYGKKLAAEGAPHGTIIVSQCQTGGRGRMGRTFVSPPDVGVYLSVILRPQCPPMELMHLTAVIAEATVQAVQSVCPIEAQIKWTNDIVLNKRKIVGILTELSLEAESGMVDYAVVGIGTNCNHTEEDFPEEIRSIATSILEETGHRVDRNAYVASLIEHLSQASDELHSAKEHWLAQYTAHCLTIGQDVKIIRGQETTLAHAVGIDGQGALQVRYPDGREGIVNSGEVSVRGLYGYV